MTQVLISASESWILQTMETQELKTLKRETALTLVRTRQQFRTLTSDADRAAMRCSINNQRWTWSLLRNELRYLAS